MAVLAVAAFYLVAYVILSTFIFGPPPLSPDEKKHIFEKFYHYIKHDNNVVLPVSRPYVMTRHSSGALASGKNQTRTVIPHCWDIQSSCRHEFT